MIFRSYSNTSKYFLRVYVTIAMVIILVTLATPISSHVKDKKVSSLRAMKILLPTSQPSEDARLARRQHYRAVRKYCVGGKNLECSRGMFVR